MSAFDYHVEARVARVTLRAPRVSWQQILALSLLPTRAVEDGARSILLTAAGPDFSHGVDLVDPELGQRLRDDGGRTVAIAGQQLVDAWAHSPVPTVVALRGRAIGAGACLAVAADFRFATPAATLAFPEVARGMHLSWGIVPRLVTAFGHDWAQWLAVGGEAVTVEKLGPSAARICDPPEAAAMGFATRLADLPPLAVAEIRSVLQATSTGVQDAADRDPARFARTVQSADFGEAMAAWFEKRPGMFEGK